MILLTQIHSINKNTLFLLSLSSLVAIPLNSSGAAEIPLTDSKEYQIVVPNERFENFDQGISALLQTLQMLEDDPAYDFTYKSGSGEYSQREGKRYDTTIQLLTQSNLNLKIEASEKDGQVQSKLKLKYNCSDPDACLDREHPDQAFPYPAEKYAENARFKLELDMHQNYGKYGLGGWIKRDKSVDFATLADVEKYFKNIKALPGFNEDIPLQMIKQYQERVFDDIKVKFADDKAEAALVARYPNAQTSIPERVEFSFKIKKDGADWQQTAIIELGQVYAYFLNSDWNALKDQPEAGEFLVPVMPD